MTTHDEERVEDFLAHYGVKGMKWGVVRSKVSGSAKSAGAKVQKARATRKELNKPNADYSTAMRKRDRINNAGFRGTEKRINRRMNKGQDYQTAVKNENKRNAKIELGVGLAFMAPGVIMAGRSFVNGSRYNAQIKMNDFGNKKRAEQGRKFAQEMLSDTRGIGANKTVLSEVVNSTSKRRR